MARLRAKKVLFPVRTKKRPLAQSNWPGLVEVGNFFILINMTEGAFVAGSGEGGRVRKG
jgi:hypothetical protein